MKNKMFSVILAMMSLIMLAGFASAGSGAVWTTTSPCGNVQDENHYIAGETVYIHGSGFTASTSYAWDITGQPGGSSGDPGITVASGNQATGTDWKVCFAAYVIAADDWGEYKYTYDGKHDNYRVDETPIVPEFGPMLGILTALGALGVFFIVRRK